jgi:hypothetical protein
MHASRLNNQPTTHTAASKQRGTSFELIALTYVLCASAAFGSAAAINCDKVLIDYNDPGEFFVLKNANKDVPACMRECTVRVV